MFAIIGTWPVSKELAADQLVHIASTVSGQPGFVHGYWGQAPGDQGLAHAVIILNSEAAAREMADGVSAAIPAAVVQVVRVLAAAP